MPNSKSASSILLAIRFRPAKIGEIVMGYNSVVAGYRNMPELTAQAPGAGYLDDDLFIKDRVTYMIVPGAENIYPAEVENALASHPDIAAVAVISVPDPYCGEAVKAIVVPIDGRRTDATSVIAWAQRRIADFKTPKSIDGSCPDHAGKFALPWIITRIKQLTAFDPMDSGEYRDTNC